MVLLASSLAGQVGCLSAIPLTAVQTSFPPDSTIRAMMRQCVASGRAPGVVVGLLDADGTRRVLTEGSAGPDRPLSAHTVFEIGSITKTFTAVLLAEMSRRGEVRLEQPVDALLPTGVKVPSRNGARITLLDLATHSSGLPLVPTNLVPSDSSNPYAGYGVDSLYAFLAQFELPRAPGTGYEYSNLGFGLLGHALARTAGSDYETLVTRRILAPLGMRETAITLTAEMHRRLAQGHDDFGEPVGGWDFPSLPGAGALRSTAADLLTYAEANLSPSADWLVQAMRDTHAPRRAAPGDSDAARNDSIGLAWFVSRGKERVLTGHTGGTGGYRTALRLDLAGRRAVVVLGNASGDGCTDIAARLLDPTIPPAPVPVALEVARVFRTSGVDAAIERYRRLREARDPRWRFDPDQLNNFGYWLLRHGHIEAAVAILRLNVREYPREWNPYDTLGEALLVQGDTAGAIANYEQSVRLEPANANGHAVLRRLRSAR